MREWYKIGFGTSALMIAALACGPVAPSRPHGNWVPGGELLPPARIAAPAFEPCVEPDELTQAREAPVADDFTNLEALSEAFNGKYEIDTVTVQGLKRPGPDQFSSFAWIATVIEGASTQRNCARSRNLSPGYEHTLAIGVPGVLHLPSLRVTVFDETSPTHDDPTFNFPTWRRIETSPLRYESQADSARMGSAPYTQGQHASAYWGDLLLGRGEANVRIQPRSHGEPGFQLLIEFQNASEAASVLVSYRPSLPEEFVPR